MVQSFIPASKLKSGLSKALSSVESEGATVIVTRRGKPIARLVPIERRKRGPLYGALKGSIVVLGDIIEPIEVAWEALK